MQGHSNPASFQFQVLHVMLHDQDLLGRYGEHFSKEFFHHPQYKNLSDIVFRYHDTYNATPSRNTLSTSVSRLLADNPKLTKETLEYMRLVSLVSQPPPDHEVKYVKDNLEIILRLFLSEVA